ncbi:MAG: hypothetical protein ACLQLH_17340 [Terracidiphilus sp.]
MASHIRVFNESRRFYMTHKKAAERVESCACAWVEFGKSVRDLTFAEAVASRNHRASLMERLPFAELPGLTYEPAAGREASARNERVVRLHADKFAQEWRV